MIVPAKQFEGELWVKATDHQRAIAAVKGQQAVGAAWVGLTDEEINEWTPEIHPVIQTIEAKLKEKNT